MKTPIRALLAAFCVFLTASAASPPGHAGEPPGLPRGLSAEDWSGIRTAHAAWEQSFHEAGDGFAVCHSGHQWRACFDSRGFVAAPDDGVWQWGLELCAYGFPDRVQRVTENVGATRVEGTRLTRRWDDNLQEWYVNDARGLEHGFTISQRPGGSEANAPLVIELAVRGGLQPQVSDGGRTATFADAAHHATVTYSGLSAWDADGRMLPARMMVTMAGGLSLEVDEAGARYPLIVDPVAAPVYVKPFNTDGGDRFGNAIAISGDTVVVGAWREDGSGFGVNPTDNNTGGDSGAAYVFVRSGSGWTQQAHLKASNTGLGDFFGWAVAISGDTVVVGAHYEDGSGTGVNPLSDNNADQAGAAYVFVRNGGTWSQQAYLKSSNTGTNDQFGFSVAVSGDTAVIGAIQEDGGGTGINPPVSEGANASGAAYIFVRNGPTWTQQAYVKASNTGADDNFGYAVALSGDTMVIGAYLEDGGGSGVNPPANEGAGDSGAAYIFVRSGATWSQQAYVKASNPGPNDWFGYGVAVSGNTVVCGAPAEDGSGTGVNPANNNGAPDSGAAYVFVRNGTAWSQQAYLKASNSGFSDQLGIAVAVAGDTVVAGAQREDGSGTRINPPADNGALDSGAAYVFTRSGTTWFPPAYVKATNTAADDLFGASVAVSGDTIAVGATDEDGAGIGVNPPDTGFRAAAGAAYFFSGIGTPRDQDSDGLADVFETYFGTSLTTPGGPPWTVALSGGQLRLRWPEVNTAGVTVVPQWSPDLVTWLVSGETRNGIPARTLTVTGAGGNLRDATLSTSGLTRASLRLRLTCP